MCKHIIVININYIMTDEQRQIWNEKYDINRGFSDSENIEYNTILLTGTNIETNEHVEYINRLYKIIDLIIRNNSLDYISKIQKIHILLDSNLSLRNFYNDCFNFPTNIDEDNNS